MGTLFVNTIKPTSGTVVAVSGTLEVSGTLKSRKFETITESTYLGATKFGNDTGDIHQFTGSVQISGATNALLVENGRVGIGTLSPSNQLEIEGSSGDLIFEIDNNASNSANFQIQNGAGNSRVDFVMNDGSTSTTITMKDQKVGIGDTTPSYTLDVGGNAQVTTDLRVGDDLLLTSDSAILSLGAGNDFTITHDGTTGATLAGTPITINSTGNLTLDSTIDIVLSGSSQVRVENDLTLDSDSAVISLGRGHDATLTHDGTTGLTIAANPITLDSGGDIELNAEGGDVVFKDGSQIGMSINMSGTAGDALFKDAGGTEIFRIDGSADSLLMAGTKKIEFGDDGTFIHQSADGALDAVSDGSFNVTVGAAGMVIKGTTPKLTIGDAGAEDTAIVFDGNAQDFYLGLDDSDDRLKFGIGSAVGTTAALAFDTGGNSHFTGSMFVSGSNLTLTALEAASAVLTLKADQGDNAVDTATLTVADGGATTLSGSTNITLDADGGNVIFADKGVTKTTFAMAANGSLEIDVPTNDLTLDVAGDIELNADGGNINIKDGTYTHFAFDMDNTRFAIYDDEVQTDSVKIEVGASGSTIIETNDTNGANANLTLDADGDIILDAESADIFFKDAGTQFLKFTNSSADCVITNGAADKDILFKDTGGNEIFRVDGGEESLLMATDKKLMFRDTAIFLHSSADGSLDAVSDGSFNVTVGSAGMTIKGTTPKLTIGDAAQEDCSLILSGNVATFHLGIDDTDDHFHLGLNQTLGAATALKFSNTGLATFPLSAGVQISGSTGVTNGSSSGAAALLINNDDVDQIALDIDASNTTADVIDITADAVTSAHVMDVTADGLVCTFFKMPVKTETMMKTWVQL